MNTVIEALLRFFFGGSDGAPGSYLGSGSLEEAPIESTPLAPPLRREGEPTGWVQDGRNAARRGAYPTHPTPSLPERSAQSHAAYAARETMLQTPSTVPGTLNMRDMLADAFYRAEQAREMRLQHNIAAARRRGEGDTNNILREGINRIA